MEDPTTFYIWAVVEEKYSQECMEWIRVHQRPSTVLKNHEKYLIGINQGKDIPLLLGVGWLEVLSFHRNPPHWCQSWSVHDEMSRPEEPGYGFCNKHHLHYGNGSYGCGVCFGDYKWKDGPLRLDDRIKKWMERFRSI